MFSTHQKMAIYMENSLNSDSGKMGFGLLRYAENPIVCVIDSQFPQKTVREAVGLPFDVPVVATIEEAVDAGAEIMALGIAPSGGKFPNSWDPPLSKALQQGLSLINGLHDDLNARFGHLLQNETQKIWDVRKPKSSYPIAKAKAAELQNKRVLLVGTDMAAGKMTTGLELYEYLKQQGKKVGFVATGQIGITITGGGIPLDAIIVDQAAGAVEEAVLEHQDKEIIIIEGQGSLAHPGSTATLPLLRGSCPTHLILCHKATHSHLRYPVSHIEIPPLKEFIELNEAVSRVCGSLSTAKTIGIALNTYTMEEEEALTAIAKASEETGLPATDVIRYGVEKLARTLL